MLKTIAIIIFVAIAALLIYAATRPDTFRVERSANIKATPEKLFGLINDIRQVNAWSPFTRKDPAIKLTYRGPASGVGAATDWEGNKDVGRGTLTISGSQPASKVSMKLDMLAPIEGHNDIEFTLVPQGDTTVVTWAMHGPSPFLGKLMGVIFNMDKMVGGDFEKGLANLREMAEKP